MAKMGAAHNTVITRDDWMKALGEAGQPHENDQGALTYYEFGAMFGVPHYTAARMLQDMERKGKAIRTRKYAAAANGRKTFMVAYRLKK